MLGKWRVCTQEGLNNGPQAIIFWMVFAGHYNSEVERPSLKKLTHARVLNASQTIFLGFFFFSDGIKDFYCSYM